jgi:hypothetical protein
MMYVASNPKKSFSAKYDLSNYTVRLAKKDKERFYLEPVDSSLGLSVVKFECQNPEERALWYKNLLSVMGMRDRHQSAWN